MTLTEYYVRNKQRALHDADTDLKMQRLIANIMRGAMCYMDRDMQVYRDAVRSIMRETRNLTEK